MAHLVPSLGPEASYGMNAQGQYDFNGQSQIPSMATGWYPTLDQAEQAWQAANPGFDLQQAAQQPNQAASLPGQVLDPSQMAALAPQPFSAFGQLPFQAPSTYQSQGYTPTGYTASTFDPATYTAAGMSGASYNPANANAASMQAQNVNLGSNAFVDPAQSQGYMNQNMQLLQQEFAPIFQQQQQNLDSQMAGRGIFNSGMDVQANNDLQRQQNSALAQAQAPLVAQGYSYSQQDLANNANLNAQQGFTNTAAQNNAAQFNAGNQQATNFANQQAQNAAGATNAGFQQQANASNQAAENMAGQFNAGNAQAARSQNAQAQNAAGQYNAGAANTAGAFGAGAANQANATNAASSNAMNQMNAQMYMAALSGDQSAYNNYLAQMMGYGAGYGNNLINQYLGSFAPANSQVLGGLNQGANNATYYGQQAHNNGMQSGAGFGNAFSNVFSGLINNGAGAAAGGATFGAGAGTNLGVNAMEQAGMLGGF